jgi:eukaryotic translation initiation factor 2C
MEGMVRERLLAWRKFNGGNLPEYMLFYRDGISESQFKRCRQAEITAIKKAYLSCAKNAQSPPQLKLTFIVVGKRHNTRFYPQDKGAIVVPRKNPNDTRNTNLKPGLYVANTITDPGHFNFYLQSHNAIQGTARSAHYHVLEHELPLKNEQLATVTHAMCYCFGRATKGVSYAAPAYIADRLCERGRVYLRSWDPSHSDFESFHTAQRAPGTPCKGAAEILQWKQTKALELSRNRQHGIWGHYDEATGRYNPWHPDIDDIMFWM